MSASHERAILFGTAAANYGADDATNTVDTVNANDINDLEPGSLAFYNADTMALIPGTTPAATDWDDVKRIFIAAGTADGAVLSPVIDRRGIMRWDYQAENSGTAVAQRTDVTPTVPGTQTSRDAYEITIIDTSDPNFLPDNRETFHVVDQNANFTVATLIDALVAAINDTETGSSIVTAVDNTTTLQLTHKNIGGTFSIALRENLEGDTKNVAVAAIAPTGTYAQISALESEFAAYSGDTNRVHFPSYYYSKAGLAEPSVDTYDVYSLVAVNPYERKDGMDAQYGRQIQVLIALPTGATQQGVFEGQATFAFGAYAGAAESGDDS